MSTDYIVRPGLDDRDDLRAFHRLVAKYGVSLLLDALHTEVVREQQSERTTEIAARALAGLATSLRAADRAAQEVEETCFPDYALAQEEGGIARDDSPAVQMLRYEHRHGVEVTAYATRDDAERAACYRILASIDEIEEAAPRLAILQAMEAGNLSDAIVLYEAANMEDLEIEPVFVVRYEAEPLRSSVDLALDRLSAALESASEAVA
jgi:hypothetical protein